MQTIKGKDQLFFGTNEDGKRIYISKPTWNCNWFWGFGYLGNKNCHYHLSNYQSKDRAITDDKGKFHLLTEKRNINMRDVLLADYELNPKIKDNLWEFCELALSAYSLKEAAEVIGRGGSHMTTNPCKDTIMDKDISGKINEVMLPSVLQSLWDLIS